MAKRNNQINHDTMVKTLAEYLQTNGHTNIKADNVSGYNQPEKMVWKKTKEGHIPDVTSEKEKEYLFEVETSDSIDDTHTEDQWKLFSAVAEQHTKRFIIVVPRVSQAVAEQRAKQIGITTYDIWTIG